MTPPELSTAPCLARTRTPPDLKWLLNERAALAGKADTSQKRIDSLKKKAAALESKLEGVRGAIAITQRARQETLSNLQALDLTMEMAHRNVRSDAAGTVHAWAGKYGKRGALKEFIVQSLREASPCALTTVALIAAATQHFGLQFETITEKLIFRQTIRRYLRLLREVDETVESLHERRTGCPTARWRWKTAPTLADLKALAGAAGKYGEPDEHAAYGEVASQ